MATDTDSFGNVVYLGPNLSWLVIGNSSQPRFFTGDQEVWEYVGIDSDTALTIAQGFPRHWFDVEPTDEKCFERAERHRREALPRLAKAVIPLPALTSLEPEEMAPTLNLLMKCNAIKADHSDAEAQYARYPFGILSERHPPNSSHSSYNDWNLFLEDLFRLLYRSGQGHLHPEAVRESIPKRWIIHNNPILERIRSTEMSNRSDIATSYSRRIRRWIRHLLTSQRSR